MDTVKTGRPRRRPLHDPSLLRAHVGWILAVTALAVLSACAVPLLVQGPRYTSEAEILVEPAVIPDVTAPPVAMETEMQVVSSAAVLTGVAEATGTALPRLQSDLSVTVPPESTVLVLRYSDADSAGAQRRAQAVADAYVAYRGDSTILSPATRPVSPSSPDYLLNATAGLVLGLMLGVGSALVRDRLDDRVRGPRDVEERTGLPVLATVPAGSAADPTTAEAYRIVRTKVERGARAGDALLVAVAGAQLDDGAGRTAEGLAVALARAGVRVVLVDADPRGPAGRGPDGAGEPGLADVLRGHADLAQALQDGPVPGLRLLGPGRSPEGLEDLLGAHPVEDVLQRLRVGGEHVVAHVAPVLGAAETLVVAALADLAVLSAVVGATTRAQLTAAVSEVRGADARVLGWVLHDAGPRRAPAAAHPSGEPRVVPAGRLRQRGAARRRALTPQDDRAAAGVVGRR
jgi:capsular polysaccharide biosynthesis protein